jgi:NADH-ubiquinone oxidoreductase chain 4
VLLKLGGYGLLRVYKILFLINLNYNFLWVSLRLFGGIIISLLCLRQIDIKLLIAYSSVAHIGLVLRGFITLSY